jgi:hypothetical protein
MPLRKLQGLLLALFICGPALGDTSPRFREPSEVPVGQVVLYRDEWGMPHVYAGNETDGFFGLGYATAQDRLTQVLFHYLRVRGELAKYFGGGPIRTLPGVYVPQYTPPPGASGPFIIADTVQSDREMLMARYLADARINMKHPRPKRLSRLFV